MSIFGRSTFSAAGYAAFRPTYPQTLYRRVLSLHQGPREVLVDMGTGHGSIARTLGPHFGKVIGVDPSAVMVSQATRMTSAAAGGDNISYRQGTAEDLSFLRDGEVDMLVVGQAAHWFSWGKTWPEFGRVVRKGGTLAIWGYKDNILVGYPVANRIFDKFTYGAEEVGPKPGMESLESYWEKPGRDIIRGSLEAVQPPPDGWREVLREVYEPDRVTSTIGDEGRAWLRRTLKLGEFEGYVRTFSSYRGWMDAHPQVKSRADGGDGDIVDWMFDEILEQIPEWRAKGDAWRDVEVESVWGTVIIVATRL